MEYNPPTDSLLDILFEDEFLLIVNKPSGLLSVPGRGEDKQDCLISRIQKKYSDALIVHRLDMSTSGLMVIARGKDVESMISILFQKKKISKNYKAIVDGKVIPSQGEINLPLIADFISGKSSQTQYKVISYDEINNTSYIELKPVTGRTHQLRVHMESIGHAILGDELYAKKNIIVKSSRLLLHASYLAFTHPISDELIEFSSKVDF